MDRRTFVHAAGAALLGLAGRFDSAAADDRIAPLLRVLEDMPRERVPGELVHRIRRGLGYDDLLAALSLAAVRNVQPYPDVGFKYHAVMVLQSVHLTARHSSGEAQWLPLIWAADYFKRSQAEERRASGWRMPDSSRSTAVTRPEAARRALQAALDSWDRDAADAAVVNYAMLAPPQEILPLLFAYGARDLREIGHKAITVQNAHRIVTLIDATHATPVLRSTVAALQNTGSDPNPVSSDSASDRPWRENRRLLHMIPAAWRQGRNDPSARLDLLAALREVPQHEAGSVVVQSLRQGISPETIWQALFDAAAELLMRLPGIVPLHAQTTANALHYAYRKSADERTQQLVLLQCAAFMAMFREFVGTVRPDRNMDELRPWVPEAGRAAALEEIFSDLSFDRWRAARKALGYLLDAGDAQKLIAGARRHLVHHAADSHDYKFSEAVFENYALSSDPVWRARHLSAGMVYFRGPASRAHPVVTQAAELLAM